MAKVGFIGAATAGIAAALAARSASLSNRVYGHENIQRTIRRMKTNGVRQSRNNDPSYRKSIWPEGKVAKPGRMG